MQKWEEITVSLFKSLRKVGRKRTTVSIYYILDKTGLQFSGLKGQSHEKFGEMRARGLSLGHN
jgi:hypothetical protein